MTLAFEQAYEAVQALAKDFQANKSHYLSPAYQESEARKDFIDKFLIALGWDVNHDRQKNPFEQEVKVEKGVSMQGAQRRADYAFYIAPNFRDVRFFAEAKKPFGDIATPHNYFQTIRYGWNAQTPIAILTDFEQFHILDCRYKPGIDNALNQCIRKFEYLEYANKEAFAFIYHLFSRDSVAAGSLDKFAETLPTRRGKTVQRGLFKGGYQGIDDAFLEDLDEYRDTLARAFKNNNPTLDGETLTELTQRTLDRLVFMRFIEDKLIHPDSLVGNFGDKGTAWQDFIATSHRLDGIYNGVVFKKHEILDSPSFKIDGAFADICEKLAPVNSPYDFNSIPIHILGSIYERFLGKVIVTTDKRARLEEKPEVRKAGGVYYTPEYIVRYIVDNTVGKLIEGKTPTQIENMRFADIACGSGSFLLGVYDVLLRYHTKWFHDNPKKAEKAGCVQRDDGAWHLSLSQRRRILLNNIYGVDIDHQAVEVAQLSLYLKLLQEETTASARQHQLEFHETLLPSLHKNIVCGNSLIGTDILSGQLFSSEEERKLNPMDYEQRFPEIMKQGGFDAIVGNPPYVRQESLGPRFKNYAQKHFFTYSSTSDLYTYFIEKAHSILKVSGMFGYIVSNKFTRSKYGQSLRQYFENNTTLEQIIDFGELPVFSKAATFPAIIITTNSPSKTQNFLHAAIKHLRFHSLADEIKGIGKRLNEAALFGDNWSLAEPAKKALLEKIKSAGVPLGDYIDGKILRGILTGLTDAFVINNVTAEQILKQDPHVSRLIKPFVLGDHIRHYIVKNKHLSLICIPSGWTKKQAGKSAGWEWFARNYSSLAQHLAPFENAARKRCDKGEFWWELRPCDYYDAFERPKIIYPDIAKESRFSFDDEGYYSANTTYIIPSSDKYLLGILNSKVIFAYYKNIAAVLGDADKGGRLRWFTQDVIKLPIKALPLTSKSDKTQHDKMIAFVNQIIMAKKQLEVAHTDRDKNYYKNKCEAIDRQINALVYELYELTPEEIKIVEEATEIKNTKTPPASPNQESFLKELGV